MNAAIINDINYCKLFVPQQFLKTNLAASAPVALAASQTYFRYALLLGCKALDGTNNVGIVQIGASATASQQPIIINPGDTYVLPAPHGAKFDFQNWYLDTLNDADGVVAIYF